MKRRLLSILLAVSVLLGLLILPVSADATTPENGFFFGVYDGKAEIYGYEDPTVTELTIPATLGGYPVGYQNYIVKGTSDTTFSPNQTVTRGQVVTLLHRLDKFPSPGDYESIHYFKDVSPNSFCYEAVLWASSVGVTLGFNDDTFRPNETCTRSQIVTFLYRNLHSYYASRDTYFSSDVIC